MAEATAARVALNLSWDDVREIVADLATDIHEGGVPDVVVGVLRGGAIPAVLLAHHLRVRDVRALTVTRTLTEGPAAAKTRQPVIALPATLGALQGLDVLVAEDVIGSGGTLAAACDLVAASRPARIRTAALVTNTENWAAAHPDSPNPLSTHPVIGRLCSGWVRFPWEVS